MELGTLISLNTGLPETVQFGKKDISTGINKEPIGTQPVYLTRTGLEGDGQGDLVFHGGADKAVCVYSAEHFPYWGGRWQREVLPGAFGENFTVSALTELDVCIGDIWSVGETVVQVSQPRQPCYKLGMKHQLPELPHEVQRNGYTGFYLRVIKEGHVKLGDKLLLTSRHPAAITIAEANRVMHIDKQDKAGMLALLAITELSASWQQTLTGRLEKLNAE
ncbi:MOSC domain-containing protein [Paenibacillus sp. CF384]|uniref:MOSC domain-containing protein n=1 Tax=Paenibacillus sp. CF384 TaxID=1884382 RepID=UPI00089B1124|nr:MOSC domain-containing protein [Paenibacillus sp. CF384]SDX78243.1 MOSC domain-containing protein YiiM [Paenibacillus sp. CF384]